MAGRTRRRGPKYTWFPTIGTELQQGTQNISGRAFNLNLGPGTGQSVIVTPVTFDRPSEPSETGADTPGALVGMVGQEYFLRRLVGKIFIAVPPLSFTAGDPSTPEAALVGAGFFVARANDADSGGGPNFPIGSASQQELIDNYSPLSEDTIREPWIWRRTWVLGNMGRLLSSFASGAIALSTGPTYPPNTASYGSVMDGPHIDAKTARRITNDERLWFVVACSLFPATVAVNTAGNVAGYLDLRILTAIRKSHNRRVF